MTFSTRRGRPPNPRQEADYGTPELREKRESGLTSEAIDLCLERGIITRDQHWCGLHLRWLYTIRYGAPSLSSHWWQLLCEQHGPREDNPEWRGAREQEYADARTQLLKHHVYEPVMRVAVYDEHPCFLRQDLIQQALSRPLLVERMDNERRRLVEGLERLHIYWDQPLQ